MITPSISIPLAATSVATRTLTSPALNDLRISNANKLARLQIELLNKKAMEEENLNQQINEKLLREGVSIQAILKAEELSKALKLIDEEYAAKIKAADEATKKILENEKKVNIIDHGK